MARTYRNMNTVSSGWTVRDDGHPYKGGWDQYGREWSEADGMHWYYRVPKYRRHPYRTEKKFYRKAHYRKYRSQCKNHMRHERWDEIELPTRTSGWLTW